MTVLRTSNRDQLRGQRKAFSFAELVIVVLVLGILAAVAIPRYQDALALRYLQSATNRLVADIRLAKSVAMTKSENQQITISVAKSSYQLENYADVRSASSIYSVDLKEVPYRSTIVSSTYNDTDQPLVFNGFGMPSMSGDVTLQSGKFRQQITISASGATSIEDVTEDGPVTQFDPEAESEAESGHEVNELDLVE